MDEKRATELLDKLAIFAVNISKRKDRQEAFDAIRELREMMAQQRLPI